MARVSERGATLIEALIVCFVAVIVIAFVIAYQASRPTRMTQVQLSDRTRIRGIHMAMFVSAGSGDGLLPLPSAIDVGDSTVPERADAKNTTASIFSFMIWNGQVTTEMLVSPNEVNASIHEYGDYMIAESPAAIDLENALWDPAFRADFTTGVGNLSYAHLMPSEDRLSLWRVDAPAETPIVGNRGPRVEMKGGELVADPESNTFLIHGSRKTWEGNIAFADGHVEFLESTTLPNGDHLFFDEDEPGNAYLGIFAEAGKTRDEFRAIWD